MSIALIISLDEEGDPLDLANDVLQELVSGGFQVISVNPVNRDPALSGIDDKVINPTITL